MTPSEPKLNETKGIEGREPYTLYETERWWKDRYSLFVEHGYELRPRLRPGWVPSWRGTNKLPFRCEDGLASMVLHHLSFIVRLTSSGTFSTQRRWMQSESRMESELR